MGNRHFFPHITNFQFELCQKINTLCCQLGSCHGASPRPGEPSETFSLSLGSQLDTRTGVASCLRLWPPPRVGVCWLLRGSRPSDEAPGSQHPCECRAPRPRHNIDPRERESPCECRALGAQDRSLTAAVLPSMQLAAVPTTTAHS